MSSEVLGILSVVLVVGQILLGIHIGVALATSSLLVFFLLTGSADTVISLVNTTFYNAIRDYAFAVIPLFILMGILVSSAGLNQDIFSAANLFVRKLRGGLAIAVVIGNAIFAAVTGSSLASVAAFGRIAYAPMLERGYDKKFTLGSIAGSSVLGMLIPPSILFIVYGIITEVSIGKLFIAGIIPGMVLATVYSIGIITRVRLQPHLIKAPKGSDESITQEGWKALLKTIPVILLIMLVLGGIYAGLFTPTEAGAVGAFGALIIALAKRRLNRSTFTNALLQTGFATASIMFVLIAAQMYARVLALSGMIGNLEEFFTGLGMPPVVTLIIFLIFVVAMGSILDSTSILLIIVPIMLPIALSFGYDPIWLGVVVVIAVEMGLITPPFGMAVFGLKANVPDASLEEIFRGSLPFLLMMIVALAIIIAFPILSTWLVGFM
jgi:tripartite ATP-independent transporter DctM subunit